MRAKTVLSDILRKTCKPRVIPPADVWVEREIRLSAKTSQLAGKYSLRHTPYLRRLYQDVSNSRVRRIVVKKGAQLGLTQFAANALLYYVGNHTVPLLMIMPSKESAQQFCERSLTPSLLNCEAIKPFISSNPDDLKKTEYLLDSCIVRVIGAGSPSKLASNPACVAIIDEADKMENFASKGEAPALELAEDRTLTFPNDKKVIVLSTPTEENLSVVHSQYLLGSQSKYFVACPHCHGAQVLRFEQVKWPRDCKDETGNYDLDRIEREAFYECEHCKSALTEQDKVAMVRGGEWRDTNPRPFPAEVRSYHISALYSFNVTFGALAKQFLLSKDDPGKLRNFYNSFLGECWQQRAETIKATDIDAVVKRSPHYLRGTLPMVPEVVLMAVDVQGDSFYYGVEGVFADGSSAVIDWGQAATWDDLLRAANRQYPAEGTDSFFGVAKVAIDSGYKTDQVYDLAIRTAFKFLPVKGVGSNQSMLNPLGDSAIDYRGKRIPLLKIKDDHFKDVLYITTIKEGAVKWYLPQDTDDDVKAQLSSEHKVEKKSKGRIVTEWKCTNRRNHYGDIFKYLAALKYRLEPVLEKRRKDKSEGLTTRQYSLTPVSETHDSGGWN